MLPTLHNIHILLLQLLLLAPKGLLVVLTTVG
jgi:hypothetical protein